MSLQINEFLASLVDFLYFFGVAVVLTIIFMVIYWAVTKHNEFKLIKENSVAAAVAFSGAIIGFALPLVSVMVNSIGIIDMVLWGGVALVVQIVVYFFVRLPMPRISERIEANEISAGIWLGSASLVGGMLNAASMTPT
jgi:putative membrane protein